MITIQGFFLGFMCGAFCAALGILLILKYLK
jgi:hypothetical protein